MAATFTLFVKSLVGNRWVFPVLLILVTATCRTPSRPVKPDGTVPVKPAAGPGVKNEPLAFSPALEGLSFNRSYKLANGKIARNIYQGDPRFKEVALTFDTGNFKGAQFVLDVLKKENVKGTFFLANNRFSFKKNPKTGLKRRALDFSPDFTYYANLVQRMRNEGHMVGNHTWNHFFLVQGKDFNNNRYNVTRAFLKRELELVEQRFFEMTGTQMDPVWRAPFGEVNGKYVRWVEELGYTHFYWTPVLDTRDWTDEKSNSQILKTMKAKAMNGGIYLFHLGTNQRRKYKQAYLILPDLIGYLKSQGYSIVTVRQIVNDRQD